MVGDPTQPKIMSVGHWVMEQDLERVGERVVERVGERVVEQDLNLT